MSRTRLVPWYYKLGLGCILIIPVGFSMLYLPLLVKREIIAEARRDLVDYANEIRNLARNRFDLIQLVQFQEEQYFQRRLMDKAKLFTDIGRQIELESARRRISRESAKKLIMQAVSNLKFGEMGFGFIISFDGTVICHPYLPPGLDISRYQYVNEMNRKKEGIIRYWWKDPGDERESERLVAYQSIRAWDWVICIGVPILEVEDISFEQAQMEGLYDYVKSVRYRWRGRAMILDTGGKVIAHPEYEKNYDGEIDGVGIIIKTQRGFCNYTDSLGRKWMAGVTFFAPKNWVIAVTGLSEDILQSYRRMQYLFLGITFLCVILCLAGFSYFIRRLVLHVHSKARKGFI